MKHFARLTGLLLAPFISLFAFAGPVPEPTETMQRIAVKFHLVTDMSMSKQGVAMTNWLTPEMIAQAVMPEVNRIWAAAKIEWTLKGVSSATTRSENRAEVIGYLLNSARDGEGRGDPERIRKLQAIFKIESEDPRAVNLYVVPYLGGTSQGHTSPHERRIELGQWTDKASGGELPPVKCLVVENGDFKIGCFSRTVAHELGHILGLGHPEKNTPPFGRLMGGHKPGYDLTMGERTTARKFAVALAAKSESSGR